MGSFTFSFFLNSVSFWMKISNGIACNSISILFYFKFNWNLIWFQIQMNKKKMTMQIDVKGIENMMSFPSFMMMVLRKEKKNSKKTYIWRDTFA